MLFNAFASIILTSSPYFKRNIKLHDALIYSSFTCTWWFYAFIETTTTTATTATIDDYEKRVLERATPVCMCNQYPFRLYLWWLLCGKHLFHSWAFIYSSDEILDSTEFRSLLSHFPAFTISCVSATQKQTLHIHTPNKLLITYKSFQAKCLWWKRLSHFIKEKMVW